MSTAIQTETRRTDWVVVENRREWADSSVAAYRIWVQQDGHRWWQRHEWRMRDGSASMDEWITSIPGWATNSHVVECERAA